MAWWRRVFYPPNSVILTLDHFAADDADAFVAALAEARRHYAWTSLSRLVAESRRNRFGFCALLFTNPRKSIALQAIPRLPVGLPFACVVYPEIVGTNRRLPDEDTVPFDDADPLRFAMTWGDLVRLPVERVEFALGLRAGYSPDDIARERSFAAQQLSGPVDLLYGRASDYGGPKAIRGQVLITDQVGSVSSASGDLPTWPILGEPREKEEHATSETPTPVEER